MPPPQIQAVLSLFTKSARYPVVAVRHLSTLRIQLGMMSEQFQTSPANF